MSVSSSIADFFQGNPFSNRIGSYIEKVTDCKNEVEDWCIIMEVCDIINSTEDGPKLAIRAIKRRLSMEVSKNSYSILHTLTLLETCVKNCGYRFHVVVCCREFLQELEKLVIVSNVSKPTKTEVSTIVRDRILLLIQTWYDSFKGQTDLREIELTYTTLRKCGIQFPMTNLATMSPIKTPEKNVQLLKSVTQEEPVPGKVVGGVTTALSRSKDVTSKLAKNLLSVQGNIDTMHELLSDYPPGAFVPDNVISLMKDLERSCKQIQLRLVEMVNRWDETGNTEASELFELLRVNDEMNNVLIRYERYERARIGQSNTNLTAELLKERIVKSHLSDVYAAQQEVTEFYDGISKIKFSESKDKKLNNESGHSENYKKSENSLSTENNRTEQRSSESGVFDQAMIQERMESFKHFSTEVEMLIQGFGITMESAVIDLQALRRKRYENEKTSVESLDQGEEVRMDNQVQKTEVGIKTIPLSEYCPVENWKNDYSTLQDKFLTEDSDEEEIPKKKRKVDFEGDQKYQLLSLSLY